MAAKRNAGKYGRPTYNQAAKIVARFNGEANLAKAIGVRRETVYRWQLQRPYGSDGLIPSIHVEAIKIAARLEGVVIQPADWVPQINVYDRETNQPITDNVRNKIMIGSKHQPTPESFKDIFK